MASETGLQFTVQVGALPPGTFVVSRFELDERLSGHALPDDKHPIGAFCLSLSLASAQSDVPIGDVLDQPCELLVWFNGELQRRVHGVVSAMTQGDSGFRRTHYHLEVRPALWRLGLCHNARIFQAKTVQEIISVLLQERGITDYGFALKHDHAVREYCVQYRESDLDFLNRLSAEEGLFYFHEFEQGKHRVVFADDAIALGAGVALPFHLANRGLEQGAFVRQFRYTEAVRSASVTLKDYSFKTPRYALQHRRDGGELPHQRDNYEHFDYPGRFKQDPSGKAFTRYRLDALRAEAVCGSGESNCATLQPGITLTLSEHPNEAFNIGWQVVRIHHVGEQPQALEEEGGNGATVYHNRFGVVKQRQTWRPMIPHKPMVDGPQIARVVGPEGEEIYCDEHGRVKLQFPWDRYGSGNDHSSCWVRVSQGWAGGQYGMMAIPRIGHEVLVSFLEGDPDQPIVTGRTFHVTNRVPYDLPANKTRTVLRTQTHKGKGFNELLFEDLAGQEEIYLHGQKDMNVEILNDAKTHIKHDEWREIDNQRKTTIGAIDHLTVEGEKRDHIKGEHSQTVGGSLHQKMGQSLLVETGQEIHLYAGDKMVMEAGSEITVKAGGSFLKIDPSGIKMVGPTVKLNSGGTPGVGTPCAPRLPETGEVMAAEAAPPAADISAPPAAMMPAEEEEEEEDQDEQEEKEPQPVSVLRIGVFFDGTANNSYNAQQGLAQIEEWLARTCSDPAQRDKEWQACQRSNLPVKDSAANDMTNIGKLHDQYSTDGRNGFTAKVYISGIGTRDPVAGEDGLALRSDDIVTQGIDIDVFGEDTAIVGKVQAACDRGIIAGIRDSLQDALTELGVVGRLEFDVFGFSRGAAAARHFINVIDQRNDHPLVEAMAQAADIQLKEGFDWASRDDVRIRFVGLFDTVVSSLHPAVNVHINPSSVERVVHLTALDEVRANFPLTRITDDAAGTAMPGHFTEIALPGAHSDVGGGYYSRWSLRHPNSDVVLTETVTVSHFASVERGTVTDGQSRAYQRAMAYAREAIEQGWAARLHPNLSQGATPPLNTISLKPYSFWRGKAPDTERSVYVDVILSRVVEGEYSRIPLHMMVEAGLAAGVPFRTWKPDERSLRLDSRRTQEPLVDLVKLDQHWAKLATLAGGKGSAKLPLDVTRQAVGIPSQVHALLRQEYLHHSAAVGLVSHPSTVASEPTVSKARRKLYGNGRTTEEASE